MKDIDGIRMVKYDPASERLMIAFNSHLEFYSMELNAMFRLYLAAAGGAIVHVPYPETLRKGMQAKHPGYFWLQGAVDYSCFKVTDGKGDIIADERQTVEFLRQYENEFIVKEAIDNHKGFVEALSVASCMKPVSGLQLIGHVGQLPWPSGS